MKKDEILQHVKAWFGLSSIKVADDVVQIPLGDISQEKIEANSKKRTEKKANFVKLKNELATAKQELEKVKTEKAALETEKASWEAEKAEFVKLTSELNEKNVQLSNLPGATGAKAVTDSDANPTAEQSLYPKTEEGMRNYYNSKFKKK